MEELTRFPSGNILVQGPLCVFWPCPESHASFRTFHQAACFYHGHRRSSIDCRFRFAPQLGRRPFPQCVLSLCRCHHGLSRCRAFRGRDPRQPRPRGRDQRYPGHQVPQVHQPGGIQFCPHRVRSGDGYQVRLAAGPGPGVHGQTQTARGRQGAGDPEPQPG